MPYADSEGRDEHAHPCGLDIFCSSTYAAVSIDCVSGNPRTSSACANAQADQGMRFPQIA